MRIGVPREIKDGEFRVALSPQGIASLVRSGNEVIVESDAGAGVGFSDDSLVEAKAGSGARWQGELVDRVRELQPGESRKPHPGQTVFGFQHFAPDAALLGA